MIVIVIGVSGAGKSTVSALLASRMHWSYVDADSFHVAASIEKMRSGVALTDADREAWLQSLAAVIAAAEARGESLVLACSALKNHHRELLRAAASNVVLIYLKVSEAEATARLQRRVGHFMPAVLIESQFDALEEPADALSIDATFPPAEIVDAIVRYLAR